MNEDNTKQIITLTLNGKRETTGRAGTKGTTPVKGTYRCADATLVLRTDDLHHIYDRV